MVVRLVSLLELEYGCRQELMKGCMPCATGSPSTTSARRSSFSGSPSLRFRSAFASRAPASVRLVLGKLTIYCYDLQGSTYIYVAHVHPFLSSHEEDVDAAVADAKGRAKRAGLEWLNKAVQRVKEVVVGGLVVGCFCCPSQWSTGS